MELEMVLANATVVTVSEHENAELLKIMKGACSFAFGVVTKFKFKIHYEPAGYSSCGALVVCSCFALFA